MYDYDFCFNSKEKMLKFNEYLEEQELWRTLNWDNLTITVESIFKETYLILLEYYNSL